MVAWMCVVMPAVAIATEMVASMTRSVAHSADAYLASFPAWKKSWYVDLTLVALPPARFQVRWGVACCILVGHKMDCIPASTRKLALHTDEKQPQVVGGENSERKYHQYEFCNLPGLHCYAFAAVPKPNGDSLQTWCKNLMLYSYSLAPPPIKPAPQQQHSSGQDSHHVVRTRTQRAKAACAPTPLEWA